MIQTQGNYIYICKGQFSRNVPYYNICVFMIYVCVVCVYVCVLVYMYVCVCMCVVCVYVCMYVCMCICVYVACYEKSSMGAWSSFNFELKMPCVSES